MGNPPPPPPQTTDSYFATFLKNHLLFPIRKEKSWQTCLLEPRYEVNYQSNDASRFYTFYRDKSLEIEWKT